MHEVVEAFVGEQLVLEVRLSIYSSMPALDTSQVGLGQLLLFKALSAPIVVGDLHQHPITPSEGRGKPTSTSKPLFTST